jgi:hypothetical protein
MKTSISFARFIERNADTKVCKLLHLATKSNHPSASKICTDALDYLTNRSDGMISYLPKGKELIICSDGSWSRQNRQAGKPARVVQKLLSPQALRLLNGRDLEVFSNLYTATYASLENMRFEFISGTQIAEVYALRDKDNTPAGQRYSDIGGSCMQGIKNAEHFALYVNNPQVIGMCAVWCGDSLVARCLTWLIDGDKYADRIYAKTEAMQEAVKLYLMESGYHVKAFQSMHHRTEWVTPSGDLSDQELSVKVDLTGVDYYPYMDTFCFLCDGAGYELTNDQGASYRYKLHCTSGDRIAVVEDIHGDMVDENSVVWSEYSGGYIHVDSATEINGEWYSDDDITRVDLIRTPDGELHLHSDCEEVEGWELPDGTYVER